MSQGTRGVPHGAVLAKGVPHSPMPQSDPASGPTRSWDTVNGCRERKEQSGFSSAALSSSELTAEGSGALLFLEPKVTVGLGP